MEDAEAELLSGYQSGTYTAEEVKAHLEWAQRVGIKISNQAQQTLKNILAPPSKPSPPSTIADTTSVTTSITTTGSTFNTTPSSSSKLSDEDMNSIARTLDFLTIYNKIKADKKKLGLKPNEFDVIAAALKSGVVTILDD